jgi:EAL domain-containing protein (putative c-di-GMP-specific phosphodiesterase class I)
VKSREVTGAEALIRWQHPERGLIAAGQFIPVMEDSGIVVQVGEWVLQEVCRQLRAWRDAGLRTLPIAVNLSGRQFLSPDLGTFIERTLESHGIEPALIEFEITESSIMRDTAEAVRTLQYLKALGVGIAIDDFGTGYSSLGYLKRFPIKALKIDRSFVRDICEDNDDATITRAIISMAHNLGLKVVAEGVETRAQLDFLAANACDEVQGYLFSKAIGPDEFAAFICDNEPAVA